MDESESIPRALWLPIWTVVVLALTYAVVMGNLFAIAPLMGMMHRKVRPATFANDLSALAVELARSKLLHRTSDTGTALKGPATTHGHQPEERRKDEPPAAA
jgi:hypothetical protein